MSRSQQALAVCLWLCAAQPGWADHAWSTYHWARTANPFQLQVVDSVVGDWETPLLDSVVKWSEPPSPWEPLLTLATESGKSDSRDRRKCNPIDGKVRVCNASYGQNGWLGLAQIWLDGQGHISRGVAKMNDSYSWYWTPAERNHVMCQELGHAFGLGHTSEDGSSQQTCMDYSTDPNSQWPNTHDFEMLAGIYSHLDSYDSFSTGGDSGGGGGDGPGCKGKKKNCRAVPTEFDGREFGELVRESRHHATYIRINPEGGYIVTHVRKFVRGGH